MKIIIGIGSQADVIYSILINNNPEITSDIKFMYWGENPPLSHTDKPMISIENIEGKEGIKDINNAEFIVGIGDNETRKQIVRELTKKLPNIKWFNAISNKANITNNVIMGVGNVICPGANLSTHVSIGNHNIINTNSNVDHHGKLHNFIHIAPNSCVCGNVVIYDNVMLSVNSSVIPKMTIKPYSTINGNTLVKNSTDVIPMYEADLTKYKESAINAINSGWVSSLGTYIHKTEEKLQKLLNIKHVILTNNGTSATHCLYIALKYRYPNLKDIYIPNNVYIAVWNTLLQEYRESDVNIHVMKMNLYTWNSDFSNIDSFEHFKENSAIVIVHNLGNIVNVPELKQRRPDLIFVEDNCEGIFGKYNITAFSGTASLCSSISFYGNKIITSGEGGAVLINDTDLYHYLHKVCHQGMSSEKYIHDVMGYNYRMTNIESALLYDQLCDIDKILKSRLKIFDKYYKYFQPLIDEKKVVLQQDEKNTTRTNWIFTIRIPNIKTSELRTYLKSFGIDSRPFFYPINTHNHLQAIKCNVDDISTQLSNECIMLPSSPLITDDEQRYIVEKITEFLI